MARRPAQRPAREGAAARQPATRRRARLRAARAAPWRRRRGAPRWQPADQTPRPPSLCDLGAWEVWDNSRTTVRQNACTRVLAAPLGP
eukprot:5060232-Prymnesium_polylepis.1